MDEHWSASVAEARALIEAWRVDYNTVRPHSALHVGLTKSRLRRPTTDCPELSQNPIFVT